jgi:drug/metabolite transporter (DMT)-like permease
MPLLGELAALTTAIFWAAGSLMFAFAGRRVGSLALNLTRITLALFALSTILLVTRGLAWAPEADAGNLTILAVSGLIGLTLGDWAYFSSLVFVGPRLATLLMTFSPPFAALLAIPFLGETLRPVAWFAMALILSGVIWVVLERSQTPIPRGNRIRGVTFGVLGALGQGLGLVLSKVGMGTVVDPLPATAIRMAAATAGVWALGLATGRVRRLPVLARDPMARLATVGATFLGPVFGVWLSLVAVRLTKTGIAATLMATTPIVVLPLLIFVQKEKVSRRAALGAAVAVAGVGMLFLR